MKAIIGQPVKLNFRNSYEGGLHGPCTAEIIDPSVQPPDLGTISDGHFVPANEGQGKITAQFIYADGTTNTAELPLQVSKPIVKEVPVPTPPRLIGGAILDIE